MQFFTLENNYSNFFFFFLLQSVCAYITNSSKMAKEIYIQPPFPRCRVGEKIFANSRPLFSARYTPRSPLRRRISRITVAPLFENGGAPLFPLWRKINLSRSISKRRAVQRSNECVIEKRNANRRGRRDLFESIRVKK